MKKISEFLQECNSHDIYAYGELRQDFKNQTGEEMPGNPYQMGKMGNSFDHRFAPKVEKDQENTLAIGGFELAEACAAQWAKSAPTYKTLGMLSGRGFRFRAAIACLEEVGK